VFSLGGLSLGIIFYYYSKKNMCHLYFYPKFQSRGRQVSTLVHANKTARVDCEGIPSPIRSDYLSVYGL
jgi:hypothetical protein